MVEFLFGKKMDLKEFAKSKKLTSTRRVEFNPQGETKYVANASESYGIKFNPEKIVFIIDDTVFGSGKDGCVVGETGIAFKAMMQNPVYFKFDKISGIELIGRRIILNDGAYTYDFSIAEEFGVARVFGCLREWLSYRSDRKIDLDEYAEKLEAIKGLLKSDIIPLVMGMVEDEGQQEQEQMMEAIGSCIDDVEELENLISREELVFSQVQYIDSLIELITAMRKFSDTGDFDVELLQAKAYDRYFGEFLKGFLKPMVAQVKKELRTQSLMNKIDNF